MAKVTAGQTTHQLGGSMIGTRTNQHSSEKSEGNRWGMRRWVTTIFDCQKSALRGFKIMMVMSLYGETVSNLG